MRAYTFLALAMLSGCSCDRTERPDQTSREDVGIHLVEKPGETSHAVSADQCDAACTAAAAQTCEKVAAGCKYEPTSWVRIGKHTLRCRAACAASCLGAQTGIPMCVEQCSAEQTVPARLAAPRR
jgi:hypothetical protein